MRILVNFMLRGGWSVHCLLEDAHTPISPYVHVASQDTLIRLLRYGCASDIEIQEVHVDIRRWGRGSVFITLPPGRKNLLRIRLPFNASLCRPG